MGFFDSLKCCAQSTRGANQRARSAQRPPDAAATVDELETPPAFLWNSIEDVGEQSKQVSLEAMHVGVRYYSEDGRHFVRDTEGNLVVSRPGERNESTVVSHFDEAFQ